MYGKKICKRNVEPFMSSAALQPRSSFTAALIPSSTSGSVLPMSSKSCFESMVKMFYDSIGHMVMSSGSDSMCT